MKGLGPFRNEVSVDLSAIGGTLVAVTGPNGAGKTTALELLGAACYRETPTRGSLADLATSRDAFLEVGMTNGAAHVVRHSVDAVSGKSESLVMDETGTPRLSSTKVRDFDGWAAKHLPPKDVLYASTFAAQGSSGFLGMTAGERKGVLLRALGIERLETLAKRAGEKAREAKANAATISARLSDERARASNPAQVREEIALLHVEREQLAQAVAQAKAALEEATAAEQLARIARQDLDAHLARRKELMARLEQATRERADVADRLANNRKVLEQAAQIRAAQDKAAEFDERIRVLGDQVTDAREACAASERALADALRERTDLAKRAQEANERRLRAVGRLADRAVVQKAVDELPNLRRDLDAAALEVGSILAGIEKLQAFALNSATLRIGGLREGLQEIVRSEDDRIAPRTLAEDDERAAKASDAPQRLKEERERAREAQDKQKGIAQSVATAERLAAREPEMRAAEQDRDAADIELGELAKAESKLGPTAGLEQAVEGARLALAAISDALEKAKAEREGLAHLLKLSERLTQAEARVAELSPRADALADAVASLTKALEELGDMPADVVLPDLNVARARVDAAAAKMNSNEAAIAVKRAQLTDAEASEKRIEAIEAERAAAEADLADWQRLADDLGRDGIQSLEIDAAGPELTEMVNDLLRNCVGSRWTVTIEASRLSADGKKVLEGCEVRVIDAERGREGAAETLSGGERVIIGEAVSLALAMLACRRSGMDRPSIIRDESAAALDPANGRAWISMMRRAAELVNASKVFFVTHVPELQELADARIEVKDGKLEVAA